MIVGCGDAGDVETVIDEIISNALNFAKTKVSVTLSASDGRATFVCSNDADDLKDGRLDTIFEKGVKSDSSTGEGMGLNRVKEIVETRGGRAGAKAENGNFIIKVEF